MSLSTLRTLLKKAQNQTALTDEECRNPASIVQDRYRNLDTAVGMGEWAAEAAGFNDACNRAEILGRFLLRYDDRDEVVEAVCIYLTNLRELIPSGWMRRDIVFRLSSHFMEPSIDDVYDDMLNNYGYDEADCSAAEAYHHATVKERTEMSKRLDPNILKILERYYRDERYYRENAAYIDEIYNLIDDIECGH